MINIDTRLRRLLVADTNLTDLVPAADIQGRRFTGQVPVPGILFFADGGRASWPERLTSYAFHCYADNQGAAWTIAEAVRRALVGTIVGNSAQPAIWRAYDINTIEMEGGGQALVDPISPDQGIDYVRIMFSVITQEDNN